MSGWTAIPLPQKPTSLVIGNRALPNAEYRMFQADDRPQHVWFWHIYDGRPIGYRDPTDPTRKIYVVADDRI